MDLETSTVVCGLIAGMLMADADMQAREASFLQRMRKRFALPPGTPVAPITEADAVAKLKQLGDEVRSEAFDLLIQAAAADGKIASEERNFLDTIASELDVSGDALDDRLQQAITASKPQPFGLAGDDPHD